MPSITVDQSPIDPSIVPEHTNMSQDQETDNTMEVTGFVNTRENNMEIAVSAVEGDSVNLSSNLFSQETNLTYNSRMFLNDDSVKVDESLVSTDSPSEVPQGNEAVTAELNSYTASYGQNKDVTIFTDEGDKVTLSSGLLLQGSFATYNGKMQTDNGSMEITTKSLNLEFTRESILSIDGDLNKQELKDIRKAIRIIDHSIEKFLSGDVEKAVDKAIKVMNLETVSGFEASLEIERFISFAHLELETNFQLPEPSGNQVTADDEVQPDAVIENPDQSVSDTSPVIPSPQEVTSEDETKIPDETETQQNIVAQTSNEQHEAKEDLTPKKVTVTLDNIENFISELVDVINRLEVRASKLNKPLNKYFSNLFKGLSNHRPANSSVFKIVEYFKTGLFERLGQGVEK